MKNDNQSALDLFNNYSDFALTNDELLAIHGGTSPGGGASDSSSTTHTATHGGGGGGDGGGGGFGSPLPPGAMVAVEQMQRMAEQARRAVEWAAEKAADAAIRALDASRLLKTPILIDHVVPPRPQA